MARGSSLRLCVLAAALTVAVGQASACNASQANSTTTAAQDVAAGRIMIGLIMAAFSGVLTGISMFMIKKSADLEDGLPLFPQAGCKNWRAGKWRWNWWVGFILNTGTQAAPMAVAHL